MAEHSFQEVLRQYKRMCCGKACSDCCFHKFKMSLSHQMACLRFLKEYPVEAEALIMNWAAEHPEPVYPSIAKYLERFGIIIRRDGSLEADFFKANEPMSADAAKLLGIEPKEG